MESMDDTKSHKKPDDEARGEPLPRDRRRFRRLSPCGRATLAEDTEPVRVLSTAELVAEKS